MRSDINIHLRLHGEKGHIDPKYLLQVLESLETSLYASDRKDIELAAKEFNIPKVIRDACLERLRQYRHHRMLITDAKSGSLELIALVAGVSYFVLEKTIGEAFSEGFKGTKTYDRLKDFFRKQVDAKSLFISETLRRAFSSKKRDASVKSLPAIEDKPNMIVIDIEGRAREGDEKKIRSLGEELD